MRGALSSLFLFCAFVGRLLGIILTGFLEASLANNGWEAKLKNSRARDDAQKPSGGAARFGRAVRWGVLDLRSCRHPKSKNNMMLTAFWLASSLMRKRKRVVIPGIIPGITSGDQF
ncbi:unnamed protein product [Linum trigynum]|uniref:Secreted protein n=1 Tax=Linum trigynum TaxID=586398 RepID=A0AAV2CX36_9ROSI